ncbi:MAG TPA: carboxypeptidase-like regulatory domain-containing protein, partial [Pyrinomonadaceae bacterium]|nr:carboxypeptidase-like regulatory domain-containing protein [Pyrinomonadaceae bacterium]
MRSITLISIVTLVALACFPGIAIAQQEVPVGQSTITGRVIYADTGRPVRRATVRLYTDMKRGPKRATAANVRGEFRFTEVVAGSYFVVAEAPGLLFPRSSFVINEFGIGSDTEVDHTRVTVDGKNAARCEIRVVRAGAISGTITYADKEPVVNSRIVLFRRKGGTVVPFFAEALPTNDRGMYRIDGLPDGEYFVGVVTGRIAAMKVSRLDDVGVATSYYPGVVDVSEAKPIQIQSGSEVEGISITLADEPLREISGVVKWRQNGNVMPNAALVLRRKNEPKVDLSLVTMIETMSREDGDDNGGFMRDLGLLSKSFPPVAEADQHGEWRFIDLPPGTYEITAIASPPRKDKAPKTDGRETEDEGSSRGVDPKRVVFRKIEVTITDEDRKNVTIELSEAGSILGTVEFEGSEPQVVAITLDQRGGNEILMSIPHGSNPDGTFMIETVPSGEVIL